MVQSDVALSQVNASLLIHQKIQLPLFMGPLDFGLICAISPRHGERGIMAEKGPSRRDPANEQPNILDHSGRNTQFLGPHW